MSFDEQENIKVSKYISERDIKLNFNKKIESKTFYKKK